MKVDHNPWHTILYGYKEAFVHFKLLNFIILVCHNFETSLPCELNELRDKPLLPILKNQYPCYSLFHMKEMGQKDNVLVKSGHIVN